MRIIIVDARHGASKSIAVKGWMRLGLSLCLLGLPMLIGYGAYLMAETRGVKVARDAASEAWSETLRAQEAELARVKQETTSRLEALTVRLANLQARMVRLDALGERLTSAADLPEGEFDFSREPSLGGPEVPAGQMAQQTDLIGEIDALAQRVEERQQQLDLFNARMMERENLAEFAVSGWPVDNGYISSNFGRRRDPFTGNVVVHEGVDFSTGSAGEEVFAVAAGVVTFAASKEGYGRMVQIDHGNGYETMYAHHHKLVVKAGDVVKKGQLIALSGSSGRSTGPHVHFEVHKNGRVIDPASYIQSTIR